jgi:hypothetical protein
VQAGAVVGVAVTDEDRIDVGGVDPLQQARHDGVAGIDQEPEAVMLHQVAAARLPGRRPGTAPADHGEPHARTLPGRRLSAAPSDSTRRSRLVVLLVGPSRRRMALSQV